MRNQTRSDYIQHPSIDLQRAPGGLAEISQDPQWLIVIAEAQAEAF